MRLTLAQCLRLVALPALSLPVVISPGYPQSTPERPEACALQNVHLSSDEAAPSQTILLSGGRIEAILSEAAELPPGVRLIDGAGMLALPAFLDGFTATGCETPDPEVDRDKPVSVKANVRIDMREANRKGIQPAFRAIDVLALDKDALEPYRKAGFGAVLSAPRGQLLAGTSVLATTRDAAVRDLVLRNDPFQHAAFATNGRGYPSTLMGYHAQLRQFFHDAARHEQLTKRWEEGRPGMRPAFDADLDVGRVLLAGEQRILCEADGHRDIERWIKLSDEFGLRIAIVGGRDAWKVAEVLKERAISVFLTLDWGDEIDDPDAKKEDEDEQSGADPEHDAQSEVGDEPELDLESQEPDVAVEQPESDLEEPSTVSGVEPRADESKDTAASEQSAEASDADEPSWIYDEPLAVKREKRRLWLEGRDCALRLREAGVRIVFCSGAKSASDLMKNVKSLVKAGFPKDEAVAALTETPAELLGVGQHVGKLEPGYQAAIGLWTRHPMAKDAKLAWLVVDGVPYEFDIDAKEGAAPEDGVDLTGTWTVTFESDPENPPATLVLEMSKDGGVLGTYSAGNRFDPSQPLRGDIEGRVSGKHVTLEASVALVELTLEIGLDGDIDGDRFTGDLSMTSTQFATSMPFNAERQPERDGKDGQ